MKKVRLVFGVVALVFAFGAAVATKLDDTVTGWRVIDSVCEDIDQCETSGPQMCLDGSFQLFEKESNNTCATDALRRPS
jgi:hypothetical protein